MAAGSAALFLDTLATVPVAAARGRFISGFCEAKATGAAVRIGHGSRGKQTKGKPERGEKKDKPISVGGGL
jgi:hypothetical protein